MGAMKRRLLMPSVLALSLALPAAAATSRFEARTFTEPAKPGLAVTGALSNYVATATAHVVVPVKWHRRAAPAGRLRFATTQNPSCRYSLVYTVRSVIAAPGTAADFVATKLPAASARHLLDSGLRGSAAWRVVRQPGIGGQVRVDALWAGVLTRRADVVPAGRTAWAQIQVTARSRKGDECHAGTWRESLGPDIGDSLAVARVKLKFTRKG